MPDLPNNTTTTATLSVGGIYSDTLETSGDRDWVKIDLDPEEYVQISLTGVSLIDPYLRVYDATGSLIAQDDDSGGNYNSQTTIGNEAGGTFYVEAAAYNDSGSGTYRLGAVAVTAPTPVDTLDGGTQRTDTNEPITVYFVTNGDERDGITSEGWSAYERSQFMTALASISAVADITFVESTNANSDFQVVLDTNELNNDGLLGYFYYPNGSSSSVGVFNASGYGWDTNGLQVGGLGFSTIVHEALHGMGLAHPHDGSLILSGLDPSAPGFPFGDYGDYDLNQAVYTIMSYNGGYNEAPSNSNSYGDAAGPMALDIAVLQEIYGANTTYANGDSFYELPDSNSANSGTSWLAIWDTGGEDTIGYTGNRDVNIDLRPATLQYEVGGGGFISAADGISGGFTIANGVVIENASGGSGNDTLTGNDSANTLSGNGGDDDLDGGTGNDTLHGNSGSDTVETESGTNTVYGGSGYDTLNGGSDADAIFGGSGNDTINGNAGSDDLSGGRGDDTINGGDGADYILGGMGQDIMTGGAGTDTFIFAAASDSWAGSADTITDFQVGIDVIDISGFDADFTVPGTLVVAGNGFDTTIEIDRDLDGTAEIAILVTGVTGLSTDDFIL
ncbi:M10 family metallopeptidase [Yoonia maritima]|uniref:M10 family metallopeptidase n=1 Tax=Yoonia maritima TaxID=1435347 RepID=UPI0013A620B1|nr:M10 family metallopeptidase C-terminal domain-containing protein [Yoonia maritima]